MSLVHSLSPLLLENYSHLLKISTPPTSSLFSAPDLSSHFTDKMTSVRREPPQTPPKLLYTTGICPQVLFSHQLPWMNVPCSQLEPFLPFVHRILPPFHDSWALLLLCSVYLGPHLLTPPFPALQILSTSLVSLLLLKDIRHTFALESLLCFRFLESSSHR